MTSQRSQATPQVESAPSLGTLIFNKYEVLHRLAVGGMGEVFYAVQRGVPGFERPAILKSLLPDLAREEGFIDQFLDEARVAATLNHPNVVSIYEVGLWNGTYFIAMEYIRGRNLSQLRRRAQEAQVPVPPLVVARVIHDAALGLDHAHKALDATGQPLNVIHRDISPQNIMVRDDGVTKVVDFGIARAANRATRTATGALKGKLAYMSPEQMKSEQITASVDQFALGVVFWELVMGRRLFRAENDLDVVKKVLELKIPVPSEALPDFPKALDEVLLRMLERSAGSRYPSCEEVARAITQAAPQVASVGVGQVAAFMRQLGTQDLSISGPHTPSPMSGPNFVISLRTPTAAGANQPAAVTPNDETRQVARRSSRGTTVAVAAALLLAVAGGVLGFWQPWQDKVLPRPPDPVQPKLVEPVKPPPVEPVRPPPLDPGSVVITTQPPGATVRVDGRPLGVSPQTIELAAGSPHYLLVEKQGFKRVEQELTLTPAEKKELTLKLTPLETGTTRPPPTSPTQPAASGPGYLSLATTPWTRVTIDGEPVGSTPFFKRPLEAGRHTLVLVNEGEGINVTRVIEVKAGETRKLSLPLK